MPVRTQTRNEQLGAALLAMTSILLVVASLGALTMSNVSRVEQRASGNDIRQKEVYSAAIGALEYGTSWFKENFASLDFTDTDSDGESEDGDTAAPAALANLVLNADGYARKITYTLRTSINPMDASMPRIIEIAATATAVNDSHVNKTVRSTVMLANTSFFSPDSANGLGFSGPPIMVENCFGTVTGIPDAYPLNGVSIGTTRGTPDDVCLPPAHLNMNGGVRQALSPPQSLWDTIFGADKTEADLLALQDRVPDRVFFVDANYPLYPAEQPSYGTNWHNSVGSAGVPVILYFADGYCPKITGGTVVWGIVYYADENCPGSGFGGGVIHGTLAIEGDWVNLTASTVVFGTDLNFGSNSGATGTSIDIGVSILHFSKLPGSWRDF